MTTFTIRLALKIRQFQSDSAINRNEKIIQNPTERNQYISKKNV